MPYKRILLALNHEVDERAVIVEALRIRNIAKATLTVVHVNDPSAGKSHMMMDSLPLVKEEDLRKFFLDMGTEPTGIQVHLKTSENYVAAIAQESKNHDLLVMGHHHKGILKASIMDSTDERVADHVVCPILLVPMR